MIFCGKFAEYMEMQKYEIARKDFFYMFKLENTTYEFPHVKRWVH